MALSFEHLAFKIVLEFRYIYRPFKISKLRGKCQCTWLNLHLLIKMFLKTNIIPTNEMLIPFGFITQECGYRNIKLHVSFKVGFKAFGNRKGFKMISNRY